MAISNEVEKLERRWQQTSGLVFAPLAEAYRKAGLHQRALEVLEQGLALHPDYGPALIVRGRCHLDSGNLEKAEAAFEQALARDPMDPIAIRGMSDVFARTNRIPEAVERLRLLVDLDPRNAEARTALERLQQYVIPDPVEVAEPAGLAPSPEPAPEPVEMASERVESPSAGVPAPEPQAIEAPLLEPMEIPPAEPAPLLIQPTSLVPEAPAIPERNSADFRIESFAVEPLEIPAETPAPGPLQPVSWTPAPQDEADQPIAPETVPPSANGVVFTPAAPEPAPESAFDAPLEETIESHVAPEFRAVVDAPEPEVADQVPVTFSEPRDDMVAETQLEPVADVPVAGYASDMPLSEEPVPVVDEAIEQFSEPAGSVAGAVQAPETEAQPMAAEVSDPAPDAAEPSEEPAPALIVTESMAELFLKQGHRELALAVYRQLTIRGPVSSRLSDEMQRIEAELSARSSLTEPEREYAASQTGGRSVEQLLQGILHAQPPAASSSVLPPAIEPAGGEPTRPASDSLPLSAVFGDEPVVAPRPEAVTPDPEPSFDEFFGAVPASDPATASGAERNPEAEDLRQFNEWLKGLKR